MRRVLIVVAMFAMFAVVAIVAAAPADARRHRPAPTTTTRPRPTTTTRPPVTTTRPPTTTTVGSTTTTMPAFISGTPLIKATDYGVLADGSTNDTVAMQAAATAAAGKTLLLPNGTTRLGEVNVPDNTTVTGFGPTTILKPPTWGDVYKYDAIFNAGNNDRFTNFKIDGNGTANIAPAWSDGYNDAGSNPGMFYTRVNATVGVGRGYRCGIRAQGKTGLVVSGVEFTALAGAAVATIGSSQITLTNNYLHDSAWELAYLYGSVTPFVYQSGQNAVITGNTITNVHAPAGAAAGGFNPDSIVISRFSGINVSYNTMNGIDRDFLKMESPKNFLVSKNTITDGTTAPDYPAIQVSPWFTHHDDTSMNGRICYNTITGPGFVNGVQVNSDDTLASVAYNIEVDHNTIDVSGASGDFGIQMDGLTGLDTISIHDNAITGTDLYAIYLWGGGGTNLSVQNNTHGGAGMSNVSVPGAWAPLTYRLN